MRTVLQVYCVAALGLHLVGCATKNDAGVILHKKPDLSKVTPGTPVNKVAGLKKPIKKEVLTKGELKGAEAWLFEWDLPNDEINNRMFTSVVVKDGVILAWHEESPDKWTKNPKLFKAAKFDSSYENFLGHMAKAARYQAAASALANYNAYNATRPQFDPVQAASAIYANSYQPWNNSGTVNYGMVGGGPIAYGGGQSTAQSFTPNFTTTRSMPVSAGGPMGRFNPANPMSEYAKPTGRFNPNNPMSAYSSPTGALNPNNPMSEVSKPTGRYNPNNPMSEVSSPMGRLNPNNPMSEVSKPTGRFNPNNPMSQGVHPVYYQGQ